MNFAVLAIAVAFMIFLRIGIKWSDKNYKKHQDNFWQQEEEANFTRRKSLDDLEYVTIPGDAAAVIGKYGNDDVKALLNDEVKIVNLNGISNTDLKLMYGAPNIKILSEYDSNYETLVKGIREICDPENENGISKEDKTILLEFATEIKTDILSLYEELADIYIENGTASKIHKLIKNAESVKNIRGPRIIAMLNKKLDESGS